MSIKNILKAFLPYGAIILHKKYMDYVKYCKMENVEKELVFDIVLSVGIVCRPAHYLKKHGLRFYANPLDWMMSYPLDTVTHLYKTKFDDFFLDFAEDKQKSVENNCHCWYVDRRNNIVSIHYDDIGSSNRTFRNKMKKRFEKINQILSGADKICFISCRNDDIDLFKKFLKEMGEMYHGKITCINIRNNEEVDNPPVKFYKEQVSEKLEFIEYEFRDVHPEGGDLTANKNAWTGNYTVWDDIVEKIYLKNKISFFKYLKTLV